MNKDHCLDPMKPRKNSTINCTQPTAIWTINFDNSCFFGKWKTETAHHSQKESKLIQKRKGKSRERSMRRRRINDDKIQINLRTLPIASGQRNLSHRTQLPC